MQYGPAQSAVPFCGLTRYRAKLHAPYGRGLAALPLILENNSFYSSRSLQRNWMAAEMCSMEMFLSFCKSAIVLAIFNIRL